MKNIVFPIIVFTVLVSCSNLQEAGKVLRNEKTKTTDEFLVKKKQPLELPPQFDKIPEPDTIKNNRKNPISEDEKIKKILIKAAI